jgi:hypothetical protein
MQFFWLNVYTYQRNQAIAAGGMAERLNALVLKTSKV